MVMSDNETASKIEGWLWKEKFSLTNLDNKNYVFCLKVEATEYPFIPLYLHRISQSDKIVVFWGLQLLEQDVMSLRATRDEIKRALYSDLKAIVFVTNTNMKFKPDIKSIDLGKELRNVNLREIKATKNIFQDGLTKDRLIDTIQQIVYAFGYVIYLFDRHGLAQPHIDPSRLV